MTNKEKLKKLYNQIPSFECKEGCHDCCGVILFTKEEWEPIEPKLIAKGMDCPYITETGCQIYKQRPFMCRLFGTVKNLKCPHGCRPNKLLTAGKGKKLLHKYHKLF